MKSLSKPTLISLIFGYAFLYLPLIFTILFSFSDSEISGIWTHFSFRWFNAFFKDENLLAAMFTSIEVASIAATGAAILGTLAAAATTNTTKEKYVGYNLLKKMILLPIIMPEIIIGLSILMLFITAANIFGWPKERGILTIAVGHAVASVAYVHTTVLSRLNSLDKAMEETAINLGAKSIYIFFHIKVPLIWKSIMSGWILAFMLSFDDLVIASFLTGPGSSTLPITIFSNIKIGITPIINVFATIFIVITTTLVFIIYSRSKGQYQAISFFSRYNSSENDSH
ncbi:MAG: ABC transporter permease subunit [Holosporales bacterium]|jgi:putrescine transport system permease protein|nr:ABC transporter permease subunit [Holosporales bacterium]